MASRASLPPLQSALRHLDEAVDLLDLRGQIIDHGGGYWVQATMNLTGEVIEYPERLPRTSKEACCRSGY